MGNRGRSFWICKNNLSTTPPHEDLWTNLPIFDEITNCLQTNAARNRLKCDLSQKVVRSLALPVWISHRVPRENSSSSIKASIATTGRHLRCRAGNVKLRKTTIGYHLFKDSSDYKGFTSSLKASDIVRRNWIIGWLNIAVKEWLAWIGLLRR